MRCPLHPVICYSDVYHPVLQTASEAIFLSTSHFPVALVSGHLKVAWMDLSMKSFAQSDKTCPPACSLISLGSVSSPALVETFGDGLFSVLHGVGPAGYVS